MATRALPKEEWKEYFDRVSKKLPTEKVEMEVAGLDLGDQVEAEWLILNGITYDPHDDAVYVYTDVVDHPIRHPREVYVDDGVDGVHSIEIVDPDGHRQIVVLREPLKLPPPEAVSGS